MSSYIYSNGDGLTGAVSGNPILSSTPADTETLSIVGAALRQIKAWMLDPVAGPQISFQPPAGSVFPYTFTTAPSGYQICDGSALLSSSPSNLRTMLLAASSPFGVDGSGNPKVPDLRRKMIIGSQGSAPGTPVSGGLNSTSIGASGGEESHALAQTELPASLTNLQFTMPIAGGGSGTSVAIGANGINPQAFSPGLSSITNTGGGVVGNRLPPVMILNYIIKL